MAYNEQWKGYEWYEWCRLVWKEKDFCCNFFSSTKSLIYLHFHHNASHKLVILIDGKRYMVWKGMNEWPIGTTRVAITGSAVHESRQSSTTFTVDSHGIECHLCHHCRHCCALLSSAMIPRYIIIGVALNERLFVLIGLIGLNEWL